ncbi:hemagglutinin repeat-containing protein [Haemophilus haemolyticus]|uniref:hemagglutinin repeat-containing protein n=1 Tax=Haemophilus haemolyticus TaxID=726 RepID=UPI001EFD58D1|nr:hemagglutinin repeat-containing protein [Haemophilus haemolyticus]
MLFPRKHHERVIGGSTGKEDGESKTYQASHLDAQTVTLNSQSDTNLLGSQVKGNTVNANVGGKLNIESLQDEERFKTKSSGGGLEVEFGFGNNWSVSGYGNASKGTTHRKQVNEQAGIFAEEGGYHIDAENVHLKGGAIASSNAKNSILQTNTLTFEDIQNESSSSAASASISGSLKESKEKWVDNETGRAVKPNTENSTKLDGQRSGGISPGLPMLQQSSDSSTTKATLTEGTVILNKDTSLTQTTAAQLGINTDLAQANNQVAQTKDVKAQIQEQQQIATAIGHVQKAVETYTANQQEAAEQRGETFKISLRKS